MQTIFSRGLLLFFTLCVSTVGLGCHNWIQKTPASVSKPSARSFHAMAAVGGDKVLLFGGQDDVGPNAETWVYNLCENTWTDKSTRQTPSARMFHAMAYIGSDRALLFGGFAGGDSDETWVYHFNAGTWTQKGMSGDKPPARRFHAMAYIGGDKVLLFGGFASFADTWVYDFSADSWTEKLTGGGGSPSARSHHSMAYSGDDTVVLFGGLVNNANRETWVYDLSDNKWTQKAVSGDRPSARYSHAMAYEGGDRVVLFGGIGSDGITKSGDTWRYDRSAELWVQDLSQESQPQPAPRSDHALAHIHAPGTLGIRTLVLFGGNETAEVSDETWLYSPGAGNEPCR